MFQIFFFFLENILFNIIEYIYVLGNPPILLGHLQLSLGQGIQQLVGEYLGYTCY